VVKATHGQTTGEILGNGDASQPLQEFALHQSPLTYLSAPTPSGAESTLAVRVNEIQWHEADNLAFLGPKDRKFITQTDNDDQVTTIFGNGEHGARVPTGTANIKAVYRYGCGKVGNVDAEQISQLSSQPLGVKSVINPLRASGGADHDTLDQARSNAPLAVMALDRLVSVRDYADFARTYAGIGKAAAARLSDGHTLLVHVTIAGKDDIPIDENSDLYRNLFQALEQYGDPYQPLRLAVRRLRLLVINARVKVLPDYQWESVGPNVKDALLDFYSFERRALGQSAFKSETYAVMQAVPGVQYVDLRVFDSVSENTTSAELANLASTLTANDFVGAEMAMPNKGAKDPAHSILPAELVMLTPSVPDTLILTEIPA
jgi:predicted phage baseplate assembly protein